MAKVRPAVPEDIPELVAMGQAMHAESPRYRGMPFNAKKVEQLATRVVSGQAPMAVCLVAESPGGALVGMFVGMLAERWFNDEWFATDLTVYVSPGARGSTAFPRLKDAFEKWCASKGVLDLAIGVTTEIEAQRTVHTYEKAGYRLAGYTMVKQLCASKA